jgi:hypothetical protein
MMRLVSAWVLVNGLLVAPAWLAAAMTDAPGPPWVSLEAALLVGLAALVARRPWGRPATWLTVLALVLGLVLATLVALSDVVFRASLGRPLNLSLDLYLLNAVWRLAIGNSGVPRTLVGGGLALLALALLTALLAWLLAPPQGGESRPLPRLAPRLGGVVLVATLALGLIGETTPALHRWVDTPLLRLVRDQAALLRETRRERREFAEALAGARDSYADLPGLLAGLGGRDVLLGFVESYGMAALDDPELAATVRPQLDVLAERVAEAGLHLVTGTLSSPTQGGQSWYAHGTVMSGLWLDNQLRYDLLIASERETLVDDFRHAGYRTVALMPAITTAWPEGVRLGYDRIYTRPTIPYAGPPLYWVTMPDQFTWSFLGGLVGEAPESSGAARPPFFVEAAMVSSHAPWIPVLPILDWDSIGDGSAFAPWRQEGHPPEELWVDVEKLRQGYAASIAYSLEAMTGFAERFVDDSNLLIVMGDHQAAPWVTGATSPAVPVHVIASDPALLDPFLAWGFQRGAHPATGATPPPMDHFRDWFVSAFSGSPASPTAPEEGP